MLRRKLWRDIRQNYGAYLACISVMIIGLMFYTSMALTLESLSDRQIEYYRQYKFADGFAQIEKGPYGLIEDVEGIPGINRATGRIVKNVFVYKPEGEENTTIRFVSFDSNKQQVNLFKLEEGKVPSEGKREILVTPLFLKANGFNLDDQIPLVIQGREVDFTITGTANSPEFIYEVPGSQTLTPDPKVFGVAFVPYETVAPLFGMIGQVNDLAFTLEGDTEYSQVKIPVTRVLEHYGLTQLIPRKDQFSHFMLSQEIVQLKGSVNTTPVIFLTVAASILYIMLRRMVEHQRGQIGILKAFGFTDWEILSHYLGYAVLIGFSGGLGGGLLGTWLSFYFAKVYQTFYNIPGLSGKISLTYLVLGTLLSLVFSLFAGYQGCKGALALSPSEAMRPPSPKIGQKILIEKIGFLWNFLNTQGKMAVRNVFRSKQRSIVAIFGVAVAFSLIIVTQSSYDAIYYLINFQYEKVERYDLKVGLNGYVDKTEVISATRNMSGVVKAEPLLEIPVTLSNKWYKRDVAITGLPRGGSLYRLVTDKGEPVEIPSDGIVISTQLAKMLSVGPGDKITVKPFTGDLEERYILVKKVVPLYVGLGAFMEIDSLSKLMQTTPAASSIMIMADNENISELRKELQGGRNVAAIHDKTKAKAQFEELIESSSTQQYIFIFFSFIMGFAIVYNVNLISLAEREREMATLMVIGMTEGEVSRILLFEQALLGAAAVAAGIPMGYGMLYGIVSASGNEIFNMPVILRPGSIITGILGTLSFLIAAQWKIKGRVAKLSMLDVLKQQD